MVLVARITIRTISAAGKAGICQQHYPIFIAALAMTKPYRSLSKQCLMRIRITSKLLSH